METPVVWMSASAYAAACAEFARWAADGRRRSGLAWEAVVYPLVGHRAAAGRRAQPAGSDAAGRVCGAGGAAGGGAAARAGPLWPDLGAARGRARRRRARQPTSQARLDAVRAAHPRLDCYGRMHSHPWPHRHPHPSGTDCAEHLTGALESNAAAGLPWSLGLIAAAPDEDEGLGVGGGGRTRGRGQGAGSGVRT